MYCTSCGSQNVDGARFCKDCGNELSEPTSATGRFEPRPTSGTEQYAPPAHIPNYLVQAILVTIFCCLPFGIVSIVYAAQVNGKLVAGDISGARQASTNAKTWAWIAFGVGLLFAAGYAAWAIFGLALASAPFL